MKLSEITEAGKYWAIDKDRKHHAFEMDYDYCWRCAKGTPTRA